MTLDFPYAVDGRGRTAATGPDGHLRDLIEQVLFTSPGERVMRPDFGSGLLGLVFEPGGDELAATLEFLVQGSLARWLGHLMAVESVETSAGEGILTVTVRYVVLASEERGAATFTRPAGAP